MFPNLETSHYDYAELKNRNFLRKHTTKYMDYIKEPVLALF